MTYTAGILPSRLFLPSNLVGVDIQIVQNWLRRDKRKTLLGAIVPNGACSLDLVSVRQASQPSL